MILIVSARAAGSSRLISLLISVSCGLEILIVVHTLLGPLTPSSGYRCLGPVERSLGPQADFHCLVAYFHCFLGGLRGGANNGSAVRSSEHPCLDSRQADSEFRIVCRAFQGIGGSGTYSLSILMVYELVPPPKYPTYTAMSTLVIALAAMLGPVFGGLITARSTWRWVFLLKYVVA